ncbi:hypothetical protein EOD42_05145 [Rhodovarius crocodyli]|uniref:Class I SAM-dependent methyltransferase n=1 Tax=Rhodovarius crocodyli TaxID=1979269 RepID=A0A437MPB2_9PROT|nr:hypothetical protein [Rhodovarius crocodyli]RVT99476.1 hypothetical protein EOD42_05145 [Rhodovarius crocodyli]
MGSNFGGGAVFNGASPSSHPQIVARIVRDYVPAGGRVMDIGGTAHGFKAQAVLPAGARLVIVNPEPGVGADVADTSHIPLTEPPFDLAMLFGVILQLPKEIVREIFSLARQRLRAGGTMLVADPDPTGVAGTIDRYSKAIFTPHKKFFVHTPAETRQMLADAGFTRFTDRPDLRPAFRQPPYYILAASF